MQWFMLEGYSYYIQYLIVATSFRNVTLYESTGHVDARLFAPVLRRLVENCYNQTFKFKSTISIIFVCKEKYSLWATKQKQGVT